jgi:sugar lactone lactonase YvrE
MYVKNPDLSAGFADPDAALKTAVVVSDLGLDTVNAYTPAGKLVATITGFDEPQGLAVDPAGNIYVVNTDKSNILVYKNDYKTRIATLKNPGELAIGVDVDTTTGLVGVTNAWTVSTAPGSVVFYAKGMTSPCVTVKNSTWERVYFGAFDKSGNFYVDGFDADANVLVGVVTGGCKAKTITTLSTANQLFFPGGVQVSATGKVAILDQQARTVYAYNPKLNGSLGSPVSTTLLDGANDPVSFAFTKGDRSLWEADPAFENPEPRAIQFTYPAGKEGPQHPIAGFNTPIGIAVTPLATP